MGTNSVPVHTRHALYPHPTIPKCYIWRKHNRERKRRRVRVLSVRPGTVFSSSSSCSAWIKKKQVSRSLHWSFTGFHGGKKKLCFVRTNAEYGWHTWRRRRLVKFLMSWKCKPHLCKSLENHFSSKFRCRRAVDEFSPALRTTNNYACGLWPIEQTRARFRSRSRI